ncbi:MAG: cupin domain-containing protein [Candidatus Angelobacter sp. Gp1-AA117]|nr:MAG: cupin domain-containing protein [Candidatus Angelobacter sp. Gp1-AA117]
MASPVTASLLFRNTIGSAENDFVIAEWQDDGGPAGVKRPIAPLHLHEQDDEAWYVLEGTLFVQLGDTEVEARAGSAVFASHGTPHTYWNPGPGPARYLLVMTSNIYRLIQEIHATTDRSHEGMQRLFAKYDSKLL